MNYPVATSPAGLTDKQRLNALERKLERALDTVDELRKQVVRLRTAITLVDSVLPDWLPPLTVRETQILFILMTRRRLTRMLFEAAMTTHEHEDPDNLLKVFIHKMRKKLAPVGIVILNEHGTGYYLDDASRAKLKGDEPNEDGTR